jgi:glycosyltransferase involved in cell wall biosynthesis
VTTDVGGTRDVVEDRVNGRVINAGDPAGMAAAIGEILGDPELAARLGAAGRSNSLSRFSVGRLTEDLDHLYMRLLAERSGRDR